MISSQLNLKKSSLFQAPPDGFLGYGFDLYGRPVYIDESGVAYSLLPDANNALAIIANKGVGLDADLPALLVDEVYVASDTFLIYIGTADGYTSQSLKAGQFITDTFNAPLKIYQYTGIELYELQSGGGAEFTTDITGTGADYNFNVLHSLGKQTIVVAVYDFDTKETVEAGVTIVDNDNITISFDVLIALGKKHKIVIK